MTVTPLHLEIYARIGKGEVVLALEAAHRAAAMATGVQLGIALWLEAFVWLNHSGRPILATKRLLMDALPLLDVDHGELAQALPVACYAAELTHDSPWHAALLKMLRRLLDDDSPEVARWHGRLLYRLAQYWLGSGNDLTKAEAHLRRCIQWHRTNPGPYDEHDRRCQLRHSLAALGQLHVCRGELAEAGARLREARSYLDDRKQQYTVMHLDGRIAEADGRITDAVAAYEAALTDARACSDVRAVIEIAAAYAAVLRSQGDQAGVSHVLRPIVEELIRLDIPEGAHRLQLLAVPTSGGEEYRNEKGLDDPVGDLGIPGHVADPAADGRLRRRRHAKPVLIGDD